MAISETVEPKSIERGTSKGRVSGPVIGIIVIVLAAAVGGAAYVAWPRGSPSVEYVSVDGSSTVYPITASWAEDFNNPNRQVTVAFSGTGGGFGKWCRGETDLSDASRPIRQSEVDVCTTNGVTGILEFLVAYDGLSVLVDLDNTFAQNLTVRDLCRIWTSNTSAGACGGAGPQVNYWDEIDTSWSHEQIVLAGPGTDSGTYDYFVEEIVAPFDTDLRDDFLKSEDDNVLVSFVANEQYSLAFFGYAYVVENLDKLRTLAIDDEDDANGVGPIAPSEQSIKDGSYAPLARPLFVYGHTTAPPNLRQSLARDVVKDFLRFGYSVPGQVLVGATGYVGLTATEIATEVAEIPA